MCTAKYFGNDNDLSHEYDDEGHPYIMLTVDCKMMFDYFYAKCSDEFHKKSICLDLDTTDMFNKTHVISGDEIIKTLVVVRDYFSNYGLKLFSN